MNKKEKRLVSFLLEIASDHFSNHGCNDFELEWVEKWNKKEKEALNREMHIWHMSNKKDYKDILYHSDYFLMSFFSNKIKGEIK